LLTFLSRLLLFLSAFAPLFFIWCLRTWPSGIAWAFIVLVLLGVGGTALVVIVSRRDEGEVVKLTRVEGHQSDVAAYVVTYLIPFVTAPLVTPQDWIAVVVFLLLLLALYVTSDLLSVNPLLSLAGLRLFRVEFDSRTAWLLAARPKTGTDLTVVQLSDGVYVALGA
jgi:hypothetical protein